MVVNYNIIMNYINHMYVDTDKATHQYAFLYSI